MIICAKALKTQFINYPVVTLSDVLRILIYALAVCLEAWP